jgi:hypothetical protein
MVPVAYVAPVSTSALRNVDVLIDSDLAYEYE